MLEGKSPMDQVALIAHQQVASGGSPIIQERIIYKEGENKENNT